MVKSGNNTAELVMGWVYPWVGLGWVRFFWNGKLVSLASPHIIIIIIIIIIIRPDNDYYAIMQVAFEITVGHMNQRRERRFDVSYV